MLRTRSITRFCAKPSDRCFVAIDAPAAQGTGAKRYACFPDFCSCPPFLREARRVETAVLCKHMLAVRLACGSRDLSFLKKRAVFLMRAPLPAGRSSACSRRRRSRTRSTTPSCRRDTRRCDPTCRRVPAPAGSRGKCAFKEPLPRDRIPRGRLSRGPGRACWKPPCRPCPRPNSSR